MNSITVKTTTTIELIGRLGKPIARHVHMATSFRQRLKGLLGSKPLEPDEAMLFCPGGSIHTLGMRTEIDVAFLDGEYRILKVCPRVRPARLRFAPLGTRYTLELAPGRAQQTKLQIGERLKPVVIDPSRGLS